MEMSRHVGVKEASGRNDGPQVAMYLKSVGLGPGYAWCADFVRYCYERVGVKTSINGGAPSAVPLERRIWKQGRALMGDLPRPGDTFGIWFPKMGRVAHTGFVMDWKGNSPFVETVEGNTNAQGSREGNQVAVRLRLKSQVFVFARWMH